MQGSATGKCPEGQTWATNAMNEMQFWLSSLIAGMEAEMRFEG
jgi:hypothetical protein